MQYKTGNEFYSKNPFQTESNVYSVGYQIKREIKTGQSIVCISKTLFTPGATHGQNQLVYNNIIIINVSIDI